jgi:hemoglobin-like flavoprotein
MNASPNPIEQSFELAAARCADLTPLVYQRLFEEHPETQTLFRSQGSELVKGSMLALTIEAILDFAGPRSGHFRLIACEVASHDAYGTPRELFIAFFAIIRDTLRDLLGDEWSPEFARAWDQLLVGIDAFAGIAA